jgi:hypothetical protein
LIAGDILTPKDPYSSAPVDTDFHKTMCGASEDPSKFSVPDP